MVNKFISGLAGICLGLSAICSSQADATVKTQPQIEQSQKSLLDKIQGYNIELRNDFTQDELKDIIDVLDSYTNAIGPISKYNLSIGKYEKDNDPITIRAQSDPKSSTYEPCQEFRGYYLRGNLDPVTLKISIAPKDAIDGKFRYEQKNGLIPKGEEGKKHDFTWVLTHEIAHNIMHQTGLNKRFKPDFIDEDDRWYKRWYELQLETSEKCRPLNIEDGNHENIRPQGYPSNYSYFANSGEQFAELMTYTLRGCHYADNDDILMKKIGFVNSFLGEIKIR